MRKVRHGRTRRYLATDETQMKHGFFTKVASGKWQVATGLARLAACHSGAADYPWDIEWDIKSLAAVGVRGAVRRVTDSRPAAAEFQRGLRVRFLRGRLFSPEKLVVAPAGGAAGCLLYTSPSPRD